MLFAHLELTQLFLKGGPIMWPLLLTSIISVAVVLERFFFMARERQLRDQAMVDTILRNVESGKIEQAITAGKESRDFVARTLVYALQHRQQSLSSAILRAANLELKRFNRGISVLDTIVTLAPLLGLLGTVSGMIHAFGLLGGAEIGMPTAISGGIAEALIATAFGLCIAIVSLLPFNYLNSRLEQARHELEDAASHLELLLVKNRGDEELVKP